jgi:hypothetical protein
MYVRRLYLSTIFLFDLGTVPTASFFISFFSLLFFCLFFLKLDTILKLYLIIISSIVCVCRVIQICRICMNGCFDNRQASGKLADSVNYAFEYVYQHFNLSIYNVSNIFVCCIQCCILFSINTTAINIICEILIEY